jgi:hypothetical protein
MVVIILTTTVFVQDKCYLHQTDPDERLKIYQKSIKQWLETGLKIIIVENSGYQFNEFHEYQSDKFEIISFDEKTLPEASYLQGNNSKGASELFSISYALKNTKLKFNFVIKITGRYFIPDFEEYISKLKFDCVIQNDRSSCEIIGCKLTETARLFNTSDLLNGKACNHIEFLYKHRISQFNKVLILKNLKIPPTPMGGANVIKNSL